MQVFTNVLRPAEKPQQALQSRQAGSKIKQESAVPAKAPQQPLWPDYFARREQSDALTWHYKGYWSDTWRVWKAYYCFTLRHPQVAFLGLRQFYRSLSYRVLGARAGRSSMTGISLLTPLLLPLTPPLSLVAVAVASLPLLKKRVPPLFQPFSLLGWSNYCIMLSLVFSLHGFKQYRRGVHPLQAAQHSSKVFWNEFFRTGLPQGHYATEICATCSGGTLTGQLPPADILIKPLAAGAGHQLRSLRWDPTSQRYCNSDREKAATEPEHYTAAELQNHLCQTGLDMLVERLVITRPPLPVCTLRILTLCVAEQSELLCAVLLPAPEGSVSTAYFDLDVYAMNYGSNSIGEPLAPGSNGQLQGIPVPELTAVIDTCLQLHEKLPEHVQISWDVIPSANGPVYLEGNVFPPGCDYKLTLFKNSRNFPYLVERIIAGVSAQTK